MVSWPSSTTRARTRANSIAVPSGLYSIEMLIQMAISRQRLFKVAKTQRMTVKITSIAIASQPHLC
jgi:hypothetical protein